MEAVKALKVNFTETPADTGIVLTDSTLKAIGFDQGAAAILNSGDDPGSKNGQGLRIPEEVAQVIRSRKNDISPVTINFRKGKQEYSCRISVIESRGLPMVHQIIAFQLNRKVPAGDVISQVGSEYHLTVREQQALKWIAFGLSSKEVAEQMNISP